MRPLLVSVVIPTWNGRDFIDACLTSIFALDYPAFEAVVVDNASTDGTTDLVAERFPQARCIQNRRNLGFAGGCNEGFRAARGEILAILNQDAVVERSWLASLIEALDDSAVGIVGGKNLAPDGRTVQMAGGEIHWPLGTVVLRGQIEPDGPEWDVPRSVDFLSGCGMAFRRPLLDEVGWLDETFWPGYYEDVDFCFRAQQTGNACRYAPEAILRHVEAGSFRNWSTAWRFHHRGRLHFVLKHTSATDFLDRFVPTEELFQQALLATLDRQTLARAYLETIRRSLPGLRRSGHLSPDEAGDLADALQRLAATALDNATGHPRRRSLPDRAHIDCLEAALRESRAHLAHTLRALRARMGELQAAHQSEGDEPGRISELELVLRAREQEIAAAREALASLEKTLQARVEDLGAGQRERDSIREVLDAREQELVASHEERDSAREVLRAREDELGAAKEHIQSLEQVLDSQTAILRERDEELSLYRQSLLARVALRWARRKR